MEENEINILEKLVGFNTIKDNENKEILDYIQEYLGKLGFELIHRDKNLIMSIGKDVKLGFLGHSDTVELTQGWHTNPHVLTQKDNLLYGLGACDMKGGIAAFLEALKEIDLNKLKNGIRVHITYDEEIGFGGIKDVVEYVNNNQMGFPQYNIIGEPTDNVLNTGCKGLFAVKIYTKGIKVHSSTPHRGKSANNAMIDLLQELRKYYDDNIKHDINEIYEVPYTTMNIGLLNGGSAINSVAAECMSYVDFRIAKKEHIDMLKRKLEELCKKYDGEYIIDVDIDPFFEKVEFIDEIHTAGFMTEASFMTGKRIILGPGPVTAHEVDEHITVESLRKTVEQYKDIINKVCMN